MYEVAQDLYCTGFALGIVYFVCIWLSLPGVSERIKSTYESAIAG